MKSLSLAFALTTSLFLACEGYSADTSLPESKDQTELDGGGQAANEPGILSVPAASLGEKLDRSDAFLNDEAQELEREIARLKAEGILDRRTSTAIRGALHRARDSFNRLIQDTHSSQGIAPQRAHMTSLELGLAADTLTKQAASIDTGRGEDSGVKAETETAADQSSEGRQLAVKLREAAALLQATAVEILGKAQ